MKESRIQIDPTILHEKVTRARAKIARLRRIEAIAVELCTRCERGEIRNTSTYARFMAELERATSWFRVHRSP